MQTTWLIPIYGIFILIPTLSVTVRRLHDLDATGWLLLLIFVPVINIGFLFVLLFKAGTKGSNAYGSIPKKRGKKK
jgi:uncharacterized membrane protein YhaH (DUF805 family)